MNISHTLPFLGNELVQKDPEVYSERMVKHINVPANFCIWGNCTSASSPDGSVQTAQGEICNKAPAQKRHGQDVILNRSFHSLCFHAGLCDLARSPRQIGRTK